jgi:dTDP-4-dehydrorhamnose reductase
MCFGSKGSPEYGSKEQHHCIPPAVHQPESHLGHQVTFSTTSQQEMKSSMPQIVITGSSGYLGQYLVHSLIHESLNLSPSAASGLHVHALYGGMEGFDQAVESMVASFNNDYVKVQVHKLDLTNDNDVNAWIDQHGAQIDVCVHTAALSVPRLCQADPTRAQALNVPAAFLEGLAKHSVAIIGLSTDQVYDGTKAPYLETDPLNPLNIYGKTKEELEQLITKLSSENNSNLPTVLLRSSIMLGPKAPILGDKAHSTFLHFCATREKEETTFWTDECRSILAVDNVVQVLRWFLQKLLLDQGQDVAGLYNMGGPGRQSRMDMAQAVFRHFAYSMEKLISAEKAKQPPEEVQSPLDITMDSSKLVELTKDDIQWKGLEDIVRWTFESTK